MKKTAFNLKWRYALTWIFFALSHLLSPQSAAAQTPTYVSIVATTPNAKEGLGIPLRYTVTRKGSTSSSLVVIYSVSGSATPDVDYTPPGRSVTILAGAVSAVIVVGGINDDKLIEDPETVFITVLPSSGYIVDGASATGRIWDLPRISVDSRPAPNAYEAGQQPGVFLLSINPPSFEDMQLRYAMSGTATSEDYFPIGTVPIKANEKEVKIALTPRDDLIREDPESVTLTVLDDDKAYGAGSPASATITINDNDQVLPEVSITGSNGAPCHCVKEGKSSVPDLRYTFSRTGPTTSSLAVAYTIAGSATPGVDFVTPPGGSPIIIPAGASSATVAISAINDSLNEGSETVTLRLLASSEYTIGNSSSATGTIWDLPAVSITTTTPNIYESGSVRGAFVLSISPASFEPMRLSYSLTGTARPDYFPTPGSDYEVFVEIYDIPANQSSVTLSFNAFDDSQAEPPETVILRIQDTHALSTYRVGSPATATVTILDDDSIVTVAASAAQISEDGSAGRFRVTRAGDTTAALAVQYAAPAGTAACGVDYEGLSCQGGTVTIPAGQASADLDVRPLRDSLSEPTETVIFSIRSAPDYRTGQPSSDQIQILDEVQPTVTVTAADPAASERGRETGSFVITRSPAGPSSLRVRYAVAGTASAGADYASLPDSVTIPAGSASASLTVTPVPDTLVEGSETVVLTLTGDPAYVTGTPNSATVTIADDVATLSATPAALAFAFQFGANPPAAQPLTLASEGPDVNFSATASVSTPAGSAWLSVSPAEGTTPGNLTVSVNPAGLAAGTYNGSIRVAAAGASNSPLIVAVSFTVSAQPALAAAPASLAFAYRIGDSRPDARSVAVTSSGAQLEFSAAASVSTPAGTSWLSVTGGGTTPGNLGVSIDPAALPAGTYNGTITINAPGASNSPLAVPVSLTVSAQAPALAAAPSALAFTHQTGASPPPAQLLSVTGRGAALDFTAVAAVSTPAGGAWLSVSSGSGTTPLDLSVSINPGTLPAGTYDGAIVITAVQLPGSAVTVPVSLTISPPVSIPSVAITGLDATPVLTNNTNVGIRLDAPAAGLLQGTLTLSFRAAAGLPAGYQDPMLRFASGGTTLNFTIEPGQTAAILPLGGAIQQGTVAGDITVTLTRLMSGATSVLPQVPLVRTLTIARAAPVVAANSVRILNLTNSGFDVEFTAYSTPRDLSTVTFTFAVAADTDIVGSATFPVDIRTVAGDWYAGNQSLQYGSLLRMRTRFSLEGSADALQSVTVTLANSAGQSAAVTGGR